MVCAVPKEVHLTEYIKKTLPKQVGIHIYIHSRVYAPWILNRYFSHDPEVIFNRLPLQGAHLVSTETRGLTLSISDPV